VTALEHTVMRLMFGIYITHPAVFVGSIVSALFINMSCEKLELSQMLREIDKITEHFSVVTSNLLSLYKYSSETVAESFLSQDCSKLYDSLKQLIEGHGRNN
jgi:hypothetical protein